MQMQAIPTWRTAPLVRAVSKQTAVVIPAIRC